MRKQVSRRSFLESTVVAGAGFWVAGAPGRRATPFGKSPNDKLNIAVIGCGGKGFSDLTGVAGENIVALCDVDEKRAERAFKMLPKVPKYHDFRRLLDKEKSLDAVVVATPDHVHAVAASAAMQRGLHAYVQKPLTHTVAEARRLTELARWTGVATQMGNQGTAHSGLREAVEVVRAGAIGAVREVHVWTNRPVWPQGMERPSDIEAIPATMRWDLWLGPAPYRPYHSSYAPFNWRGVWDFGTGALGDMACHTMNLPYLALQLGAPSSVEAECGPFTDDSPPKWSVIRFEFPARGERPPVTLHWYDGGKKPAAEVAMGRELKGTGSLMIGEGGRVLYSPGDYGTSYELWPEKDFEGYQKPAPTLPRVAGVYGEWLAACKGGPAAMSHFEHAGPFTETVLLGNLALRTRQKIEWDTAAMRAVGCPDADRFIHSEYRWGYSV